MMYTSVFEIAGCLPLVDHAINLEVNRRVSGDYNFKLSVCIMCSEGITIS